MKAIKYISYFFLLSFSNFLYPQVQFFPPVDTAYIYGGCTATEIICHNLVSTSGKDSISIEPGLNTSFYYYDSLGNTVSINNFYFLATDPFNQLEYELWYSLQPRPPYTQLILFDSTFNILANDFFIILIVKTGSIWGVFFQSFHADFGLGVETTSDIPTKFDLSQNYPNPFNPSTKIKYEIPSVTLRQVQSDILVTLKVYDVLGNKVATLVNEEKPAGNYEVEFNATGLPSGIYFYQLKAGNFVETKKMILMK